MANWSGTYSITTPGTTATSGTTTTLTNTAASWPTGGTGLANFTLRMLTGSNAGLTRVISSNTATTITVASAFPNAIAAGDTYEIILLVKNNDHFTANTTFGTNIISEYEDGATIYIDGNYLVIVADTITSVVRGNKTLSTMIEWTINNPTVQGTYGAWSYIQVSPSAKASNIDIHFWKISYSNHTMVFRANTPSGNGQECTHIWAHFTGTTLFSVSAVTLTQNTKYSNIVGTRIKAAEITATTTASTFTQVFEKFWINQCTSGGPTHAANSRTVVRDCVFHGFSHKNINLSSGFSTNYYDNYIRTLAGDIIVLGAATTAAAGSYSASRNVSQVGRMAFGPSGTSAGSTMATRFNDIIPLLPSAFHALDYNSSTFYSTCTSDNDFLAGNNNATPDNVDTTAATTSTATPQQYRNLTAARTNPKSSRNRPLTIDNVVVGTPTSDSVTITFDCANGAVAGHGSTNVNADSSAGTAVLFVSSTSGFEVGDIVEIGYGTVRFEQARVSSISVGVSLTLETNLVFTHTAAQSDSVKKQLRTIALPFIEYGTVSGVYTTRTPLPVVEDRGLIWAEIKNTFNGISYTWKHYGHSITLSNLKASTTYYFKCFGVSPLDEILESSEGSFTTAAASGAALNYGFAC